MRNDLTNAFVDKMKSEYRKPIQFVIFHFSFGDVYLSDRDLIIDGNEYSALIEDWGVLSTSGYDINDIISETLEITISIWNGGKTPFTDYFYLDEPTNVEIDIYQTFEGLEDSDKALIGSFVIQDPIQFSENTRLLSLDLVSPNLRYTANIGPVLTAADWPKALESDLNKGIDLIIGDAGEVKTLCAKTPLQVTMKGSILKLKTIVNTYEDLDELGFPQTGYLIIDDEMLHYSSRDEDTFTIDGRGLYGTIASDHSDGVTILEYITDHTYIIGQGPLSSVYDVFARNRKVDPSEYTLDLESNPATITFAKQPTYIEYPKGARSTDVDFDITLSDNTAFQPYYAYDVNSKAYGAIINDLNPRLSIANVENGIDEGEVVRAFLLVEHWSTKYYANDRAIVYVDGIGEVGRLSRPNQSDIVEVDGNVDLDHGHAHRTGGNHNHGMINPNIATANPSHGHSSSLYGNDIVDPTNAGLPVTVYQGYSSRTKTFTFGFTTIPTSGASKRAQVAFYARGVTYVSVYTGSTTIKWYNDVTVNQSIPLSTSKTSLTFTIGPYRAVGAYVKFTNVTIYTTPYAYISNASTAVTGSASGTTARYTLSDTSGLRIKESSDVYALSVSNEPINITQTTSSSKKVTDKFDLTKHLETINWEWFVNRRVYIVYTGTNDKASIFITYINFEVEYRQRQTILTNDVYCKPIGSIENRPDAVLQYILNQIAGIPFDSFGSIWAQPEVWNDETLWDDSNNWVDSGEKFDAPEGAAFEEAGSRYAYLGYRLDGVISANETVQSVAKEICRQARGRLLWSGGKIKLAVREKLENWVTLKQIGKDETQLKSVSAEKEQIDRTYNDIDLFYKIDRNSTASDESKYNATVSVKDQESINKHGQRKDNSEWLFDLVRSDAMAADLADYYLWRYGRPITKYSFITYLQQFDVEKDDTIRFTSDFARLYNLPLRISNNERTFGSAKLETINTINLIGESIRHNVIFHYLSDSIGCFDDIDISFTGDLDTNDSSVISEDFIFSQTTNFEDSAIPSDSIYLETEYNSTFADSTKASDVLTTKHSFNLEDEFSIIEEFGVNYEPCFGACGFGGTQFDEFGNCTLPFGAITEWYSLPLSEFSLLETVNVSINFSLTFDDSALVTDKILVSELIKEEVTFGEELIFNSCFGCPVDGASGFGLSNFGA